jgi:hypothetical protein
MNVGLFTIHVQNAWKRAADATIISLYKVKKLEILEKTVIVVVMPLDFHITDDNFWQYHTSGTKHVRWPKEIYEKQTSYCMYHTWC